MTALSDAESLLTTWHPSVVSTFDLTSAQVTLLTTRALGLLGIDVAGPSLTADEVHSTLAAIDVVVWRWVEGEAALLYDFSADGGSYQRSQMAASASKMRMRAEANAAALNLTGFEWPAVEISRAVPGDYSDEVELGYPRV